jgi:hypothetical protein
MIPSGGSIMKGDYVGSLYTTLYEHPDIDPQDFQRILTWLSVEIVDWCVSKSNLIAPPGAETIFQSFTGDSKMPDFENSVGKIHERTGLSLGYVITILSIILNNPVFLEEMDNRASLMLLNYLTNPFPISGIH